MSYTFSDQQTKLSSLLGDPNTGSDDMFPLAVRKKALNRGELHFARDTKAVKEYATGTVSGNTITLPSDWIETHILVIDDKVVTNKREVSLADYERYYQDTSEYYHYVWESSGTKYINFFNSSASGQTYKLWYFKKPTTELDDDTDTSLLPEEYREASVYYAAAELLEQIGKTDLANQYRQLYASYISNAVTDLERNYIDKKYPLPDMGDAGVISEVDRQGKGWQW